MKTIEKLIQQLELFSSDVIDLKLPIDETRIIELEKNIGIQLPNDYKAFLRLHNGLTLMGTTIYGINNEELSIEECYSFEHYEVDNQMPENIVPFSPDGSGNHYCFDTQTCNAESCEIVFWQHDFIYNNEHKPEVVNVSFSDWLEEVVIDWTLEDYDYNGNKK